MAEIIPFRALRYDNEKIGGSTALRDVLTPPYDVISAEECEKYRGRSPYNFVHIDLPNTGTEKPLFGEDEDPYQQARARFLRWIREGVLLHEDRPSLYYYEIDYVTPSDHIPHTRKGFFTLLRLEEFRRGCVYPHEKTFSRVKEDRLRLTMACEAHLSPIFAVFPDADTHLTDLMARWCQQRPPLLCYEDDHQMQHRLWRIDDPTLCHTIQDGFKEKEIYIADGHHRYETALAYRDAMREKQRGSGSEPYEFVLMYLSPLEDPGLMILPTHRLFPSFSQEATEDLITGGKVFFEMRTFAATDDAVSTWLHALDDEAARGNNAFCFVHHQSTSVHFFRADAKTVQRFLRNRGVLETFHDITVVILDRLVFAHLLRLDQQVLEDEKRLCFSHDARKAFREIMRGTYQAGFFITPTRIDQVTRVASECLVMPHKSTYFYPKVVSGLVMHWMPSEATLRVLGKR